MFVVVKMQEKYGLRLNEKIPFDSALASLKAWPLIICMFIASNVFKVLTKGISSEYVQQQYNTLGAELASSSLETFRHTCKCVNTDIVYRALMKYGQYNVLPIIQVYLQPYHYYLLRAFHSGSNINQLSLSCVWPTLKNTLQNGKKTFPQILCS